MSLNESEYRINIESLRNALGMIHSTPGASLIIEPHRIALIISGEYAWTVHGLRDIAHVLSRTADHFFENHEGKPVEPILDKPTNPKKLNAPIQFFHNTTDTESLHSIEQIEAAAGYQVDQSAVETEIADYRLDDCYTIVFSLDGSRPFVLPNSAKPKNPFSADIPFSFRDATGRIFQGPDGWGGEFTFCQVQMKLKAEFVGPDTVQEELEFIVDILDNFDIGEEA